MNSRINQADKPVLNDAAPLPDTHSNEQPHDENPDQRSDVTDLTDCPSVDIPSLPDVAEELPPFSSYHQKSDQELKNRAMLDDGYAQQYYARRIQSKLIPRLFNIENVDSLDRNTRYRMEHEFKSMRNFYVLAVKNRSRASARRISQYIEMNPMEENLTETVAWGYIEALMGGDDLKSLENAKIISLTPKQRLEGLRLAEKYIEIFNLWFLKSPAQPHDQEDIEHNVNRTPKECLREFADYFDNKHKQSIPSDRMPPPASSSGTEKADKRNEYTSVIAQLEAYETELRKLYEQGNLADNETTAEKRQALHKRFRDIRLQLISALQSGNRATLPVLVDMHLKYAPEHDPLEAAAWESIATNIYGYSTDDSATDDLVGMTKTEFDSKAETLASQYISMYELENTPANK